MVPLHDVPWLIPVYGVEGRLEVDKLVVRWDLALSALIEDLPKSKNLISYGFASNKPSLVAADEICNKGR